VTRRLKRIVFCQNANQGMALYGKTQTIQGPQLNNEIKKEKDYRKTKNEF